MSKRGADTYLTHDNYDDEDDVSEEPGVFAQANADTLKTRQIKKARRRVVPNSGDDKPMAAFQGFTGLTGGTSGAPLFNFGATSAGNTSTSTQPQSLFNFSSTLSTTSAAQPLSSKPLEATASSAPSSSVSNGSSLPLKSLSLPVSSGQPVIDFGFVAAKPSSANVTATQGVKLTASSATSSGSKHVGETMYRQQLKKLNESVLRWIEQHVHSNPYCILTPIFQDYSKYIDELDKKFPKVEMLDTEVSESTSDMATDSTSETLIEETKSGMTSTTSNTLTATSPGFFKSQPSSAVQSSPSTQTSAPSGSFLSAATDAASVSTGTSLSSAFSSTSGTSSLFSTSTAPATTLPSSTTPAFAFGSGTSSTFSSGPLGATSSAAAATFGSAPASSSGFLFGTGLSSAAPSFGSTSTASSGFTFGTGPSFKALGATGGPAFGTSGFTFGAAVGQSAGDDTTTPANGDDDEEYVPPKPEVVEIKEDDAFYNVKCKLFYMADNQWKERGVGNLFLKPCNDKTQLLIRADTSLGNILLNINLSKGIPISLQGNTNVSLSCIPNPPLDEKKPSQTPVCMLIRVKKPEDAAELLKQLNDNKK